MIIYFNKIYRISCIILVVGCYENQNTIKKINDLEQKVNNLEIKLNNIEDGKSKTIPELIVNQQQNTNQEKYLDKMNWRKLKRGMSPSQVREILGEPKSIEVDMVITFYKYDCYPICIMSFDKREKLLAWQEPR